jgi:hypothetical protein
MAITQAFQDIFEIGEGLNAVELGGGEERCDDRPAVGAAVGSGEEGTERLKPQSPKRRVRVVKAIASIFH